MAFARIDHALFIDGNVNRMWWPFFTDRSDTLPAGTCSAAPPPPYFWGSSLRDQRTCFVIPPLNKQNFIGETHEEALAACHARCRQEHRCDGVNVVPLVAPLGVAFSDALIPYGTSNCDAACFEKEAASQKAESYICYPLHIMRDDQNRVEEMWTTAANDPMDMLWYSSAYLRVRQRTFTNLTNGVVTSCAAYVSAQFPNGMCSLPDHTQWRFGERCISCADAASPRTEASTVPRWALLPSDDCRMCDHIEAPSVPAPTPAPTIPQDAFGDRSYWEKNWTSPDGALFIGWKFGGAVASDLEAAHALTFMLSCPGCDGTGWVAIGINPGSPTASSMVGTSAVVWQIGASSAPVREFEIGAHSRAGIIPWGSRNHIDRIAIDPVGRHCSFSIGIGTNAEYTWNIGSAPIDNVNSSTQLTYVARHSLQRTGSIDSHHTLPPPRAHTHTSLSPGTRTP